MSKPAKIALGLATVWPLLYVFCFIGWWMWMVFGMMHHTKLQDGSWIVAVFAVHGFTMLWSIALTVFYAVNVYRNPHVEADKRVLWLLVVLLSGPLGSLVYWYLYIWRAGARADAVTAA